LDGRIHHFEIVESEHKIKDVSHLFGEGLLTRDVFFGVGFAKGDEKLREARFQLEGEIVEFLQLFNSRNDSVPGSVFGFGSRGGDSLSNGFFTTSVIVELFQNRWCFGQNRSDSVVDLSLFISARLRVFKSKKISMRSIGSLKPIFVRPVSGGLKQPN